MRQVRQYDDEFKREAVRLVKSNGKNKSEIARDLGINPSTLHGWVNKSVETDTGEIITGSEITRLKRELADVTLERDILKKAVAIFSKPSR
jgi:transposase